jgi:signal transduction histidine kinase
MADDLPSVTGDRVQLQQVILNLLRNASEAMDGINDRSRRVVIRTARSEHNHVRLSVEDVGVGLDQHGMDTLFKAFYTTKADGMGIGLAISRTIIESHRGRLWATPNDGPGITLAFSIPRATNDEPTRLVTRSVLKTPTPAPATQPQQPQAG